MYSNQRERIKHRKISSLYKFGDKLNACGTRWNNDIDLAKSGVITKYTGKASWFDTSISGVIGMHGNEPGEGPSLVINDIENSGIDMIWTSGLKGCMGLVIIGKDKTGKINIFFGHARQYEQEKAIYNVNNPMCLAHEFVQSHDFVRVLWGTDFHANGIDINGAKKSEAQLLLGRELGCWVHDDDCIPVSEFVFFPKLRMIKNGNIRDAYYWVKKQDRDQALVLFPKFEPNETILKKLEDHLESLRKKISSPIRLYHSDSKRANKIFILEKVVVAYKVGMLDILQRLAQSAEKKLSPLSDKSAKNVWSGDTIIKLVQEAYQDQALWNRQQCVM